MSVRVPLLAMLVTLSTHRALAQIAPHYTLVRDLRIDAHTTDLSVVSWLTVSRTGTIAVGQTQDHLVRFFDANGRSLGTFGRDGAGPGEFRGTDRAGWIGDTMWVADQALHRFTFITPGRKLLRNVPMALAIKSQGDTSNAVQVMGAVMPYRDGSQLMYAMLPSNPALRPAWARDAQHTDSRLVIATVTAKGDFRALLSFQPKDPCGMVAVGGYQLCGRGKVGISPAGQYIAWASMSVAGADSGTYRIDLVRQDGRVIYSKRYPFVAQLIPAHVRDSLAELSRKYPAPNAPPSMLPTIGPPAVYAPVESVIIADDGTTLVQLRAIAAGIPWMMLSPRGDVIGSVVAPANLKLIFLGPGMVWGTETDADDVESVVRYRVVRR